jgi:hypothetical protein
MSQEQPGPPPVDPWSDGSETEQLTQPASYPPAPWETGPTEVPAPGPWHPPVQPPVRPADVIGYEPPTGGRRRPVVVLAVVVVALLLAGGVVLGRVLLHHDGTGSGTGTGALGSTGAPAQGQPNGPSTVPSSAAQAGPSGTGTPGAPSDSPTPAPSLPPGRPQSPGDALALTDTQAATELGTEADEDGPAIAVLAGSWVPQVDGKCVGVAVDIQPSFVPDGTPDTPHVTVQQILAFHLSLHQRFGALTARQSQLGIGADTATSGPCAGQLIWNSVVPRTFGTSQEAIAWCDANVPPVHECLARYVARHGETSRAVERG